MAKDCYNQVNTITFRTVNETVNGTKQICVQSIPRNLKFCKRINLEIFLTAPGDNTQAVKLTFDQDLAKSIFHVHPKSPLTLDPGNTSRWEIKRDIADLEPRDDYGPHNPKYSRVFHLNISKECSSIIDVNDVHIEC